ncbi:MAG TPA: hypothetical protein VFC61_05810, partial [Blastocatellia bacterium]|nr:hypothetical protein [Blastocatellia bacterium]
APAPIAARPHMWQELPRAPVDLRIGLTSVWTGTELIVSDVDSAASYEPITRSWKKLPDPPEMDNFCRRSAAWTGKEMIVWGCGQAAFDPLTGKWRELPPAPTRHGILVWTGRELIGWGGGCCGDVSDDGSAYDPKSNTWRKLAPAPIPGQQSPAAVWTGHELVVLNGYDPEGEPVGGAAYDPRTDTWRRIPSLRQRTQGALAVWSGGEVLLVGGGTGYAGGYALDPAVNRWRELRNEKLTGLPLLAVWTGMRVIELGPKATAYEPITDRWSILPTPPQALRQGGAAVWTGAKLFVVTPSGVAASVVPPRGKALGPPPPLPQCCGGG